MKQEITITFETDFELDETDKSELSYYLQMATKRAILNMKDAKEGKAEKLVITEVAEEE